MNLWQRLAIVVGVALVVAAVVVSLLPMSVSYSVPADFVAGEYRGTQTVSTDCGSLLSRQDVERRATSSCDDRAQTRLYLVLGLGSAGVLVAVAGALLLGLLPGRRQPGKA